MRPISKSIFREGLGRAVVIIMMVAVVLIDAAWRDDSNGGQFVKLDDLDSVGEIPTVKPDWAELSTI